MTNEDKVKQLKDQEEWLKLVHESACCSYDSTLDDEKRTFLAKLEQEKKENTKRSKEK